MTAGQAGFASAMRSVPLVGILRGVQPHEALSIGQALFDVGWRLIEVPLNSPRPLESIEALVHALPQAVVGAGTVLTPSAVRDVHAAGGRLVVAPNFNAAVVREALRLGLVCLPGVTTPSEAFAALDAGASGLKLFPAEMIPPPVVKALRSVLDTRTLLLPVGGITPRNIAAYRAVGANGFGIGTSLYKPGMEPPEVARNAQEFLTALRQT